MFSQLHKLKDPAFFQEHRALTMDTPEDAGDYEIVSVYEAELNPEEPFQFYRYAIIEDPGTFAYYSVHSLAASLHPSGGALTWGDRLLTLVTCTRHGENRRLVVVARRVTQ